MYWPGTDSHIVGKAFVLPTSNNMWSPSDVSMFSPPLRELSLSFWSFQRKQTHRRRSSYDNIFCQIRNWGSSRVQWCQSPPNWIFRHIGFFWENFHKPQILSNLHQIWHMMFRQSLTKVTKQPQYRWLFNFRKRFSCHSQSKSPNRKWAHISATLSCTDKKLGTYIQYPFLRMYKIREPFYH